MKKVLSIIKWLVILAVVVVVLLVVGKVSGLLDKIGFGNPLDWFKSEPSITSVSSLKKVVEVEELNALSFEYRGMVAKYKEAEVSTEETKKELEYAFSYDATVKASIDARKIKFSKNEDEKIIEVKLPPVKINDKVSVSYDSIDYLVEPEGMDITQINKLCNEDVKKEVSKSKSIKKYAKENAEGIVRSIVEPLVKPEGYKVEFK